MRLAAAISILISLSACKRHPKPPAAETPPVAEAADPSRAATAAGTFAAVAPAEEASMADVAPAPADNLRGRVAEKIEVAQYTYLRIQGATGDAWAAVPKSKVMVGDTVAITGAVWMENFQSKSLGRSWERIAFGTLEGETASDAPRAAASAPRGAGMFAGAARAAPGSLPPGHPPQAAAQEVGDVKVSKAEGPRGRTIADIYGQRAQLEARPVLVRGKVVKATNDVMGKNWLHLRDGSGSGATADLTVASTDTAKVGDTVLFAGTVRLNRDLGAGYHYDVIVEDAKLQAN